MATLLPLAVAAAAASASSAAPTPGVLATPLLAVRPRLRRSPRSVACALRRRPTKYKNRIQKEEAVAVDGIDDGGEDDNDAVLEAIFMQLEEDLKNHDLSLEDDDEGISEEDMARFEQELAEAIGDVGGVDDSAVDPLAGSEGFGQVEKTDAPELKNWQLRRLAHALKVGRRKTSIKNLAGELGLDRSLVLGLLRNPPPKLLFMSDSLPDEAPSPPIIKEIEHSPVADVVDEVDEVDEVDATETKPQMDLPIHVMSAEWSAQKRLKKVQLETLERVYLRTKRPTNTMISSIIQVTNLPRKTVIKWFEDKREQDGVPDHRVAFKRSLSQTIAS